ncbi:hypothetical protein BK025_17195 [Sodalis sp. TME1]|nr:hypothetical protein BK025_17195 [Sodalis sp. TME1]
MTTFTQHWQQLHWDDVGMRIHSQTAADVERALAADNPGPEEMMALAYLEPLAQRAQRLTRRRFGNTINFYLPLYLSNLCANDCTYYGFSMSNRIRRKTLDEREILSECRAKGIDNVLLVTGEHKSKGKRPM